MVEVWLPYGSSEVAVRVPEEVLVDILKPQPVDQVDVSAEVKRLVASNSELHRDLKAAERICIAVGGSRNRQIPEQLVGSLLQELKAFGVEAGRITLLLTPDAPIEETTLPSELTIIRHSAKSSQTAPVAGFEGDFRPATNTVLTEAPLRILVGELWPNSVLEFSGLTDIVFPDLGSEASIQAEISGRKPLAPVDLHKERLEVAMRLPNLFVVGYVLNENRLLARMDLGSFESCINNLSKTIQEISTKNVEKAADIVIMGAGGKPMDESLLRAVECFPNALGILKRNGALIVAAECSAGHGGTDFYAWTAEKKEPRHLETRLRHTFNFNGWKAVYLARVLQTHRIYLISTIPDYYVQNVFGLRAGKTVNAALQSAQRALGAGSKISVIPDASGVVAALKLQEKPT